MMIQNLVVSSEIVEYFVNRVFNSLFVLLENNVTKVAHVLAREFFVLLSPFSTTLPPNSVVEVLLANST